MSPNLHADLREVVVKQARACPPHTAVPRKLCICKTAVSDWRAGTQVFTADPSWPISFHLRRVHVLHSATSITPWWVQASYLYLYIYIFGLAQVWWNQRLHVECRSSLQHFVAFRNTGERTNICFHILIAFSDFDLHEIFFLLFTSIAILRLSKIEPDEKVVAIFFWHFAWK